MLEGSDRHVLRAEQAVGKFSILAARRAFALYGEEPSGQNLARVALMTGEAQRATEAAGAAGAEELNTLVSGLAREVANRRQQAPGRGGARQGLLQEFVGSIAGAAPGGGGSTAPTSAEQSGEEGPAQRRERSTIWVEFKVVWADTGEPVPRVRLRVTTPDGLENFHTTNAEGLLRVDGLDPGQCVVRSDLNNPRLHNTLGFAGTGQASGPAGGGSARTRAGLQQIAVVEAHKVKRRESIKKLAEAAGLTWQQLARVNWDTEMCLSARRRTTRPP